ncbi:MAG: stage V sporulation protein AC [Ruminococcaceae bacterium]|nr:stage V sporulation protein AC [Oscillospiraceae bacterium]
MKAEDYQNLSEKTAPKSPIMKDIILAFLIGGTICTVGQVLYSVYYDLLKFNVTDSKTYVSITLIFLSALLTGTGVYDKIAKYGGAGTLVPITGFANAMVSPALEFKTEGYVLGLGTKIFAIAGPVIVYGTTASVIYGIIYYIITKFI